MSEDCKSTRRRFLERVLASSAVAIALPGSLRAQTNPIDPTSRELFDATDEALNGGRGFAGRNNETGTLGWGGSYTMQAYLLMYLAHRDTMYLDKLVAHIDAVLAQRDSVRGVTDYRGRSLPAWRAMHDYTCGSVVLKDAQGRDSLEVRTAVRPAGDVAVSVAAGGKPSTFKLIATKNPDTNSEGPVVDIYDDLTLDTAALRLHDDFARVNGTPAGARTMLTAWPARGGAAPPGAGGPVPLVAGPYVFAVHTGQITYPIAAFVRHVRETPALHERYKARADEYLVAVEQALAASDDEWRENEKTGEGWYVWTKGSPAAFDGAELPHNQYLAVGRTMIHLAALPIPSREKYKAMARKMARTFKNDLTLDQHGGYVWPYFWSKGWGYRGWKESDDVSDYQPMMVHPKVGGHKNIEDTSHAHLDVDFARLAFENNLGVFDETDMKRFATTFTRNVLTTTRNDRPTTFANVDGTGGRGSADTIAAGWMPMAKWDKRIYESVKDIYAGRTMPKPDKAVALLMGLAYLNWYARQQ
jgi:hypothetical protein